MKATGGELGWLTWPLDQGEKSGVSNAAHDAFRCTPCTVFSIGFVQQFLSVSCRFFAALSFSFLQQFSSVLVCLLQQFSPVCISFLQMFVAVSVSFLQQFSAVSVSFLQQFLSVFLQQFLSVFSSFGQFPAAVLVTFGHFPADVVWAYTQSSTDRITVEFLWFPVFSSGIGFYTVISFKSLQHVGALSSGRSLVESGRVCAS